MNIPRSPFPRTGSFEDLLEHEVRIDGEMVFMPRLFKVSEVAKMLNVHTRTVHSWIEKGSLPSIELPSDGNKPSHRIAAQAVAESLGGSVDGVEIVAHFVAQEFDKRVYNISQYGQ